LEKALALEEGVVRELASEKGAGLVEGHMLQLEGLIYSTVVLQ